MIFVAQARVTTIDTTAGTNRRFRSSIPGTESPAYRMDSAIAPDPAADSGGAAANLNHGRWAVNVN